MSETDDCEEVLINTSDLCLDCGTYIGDREVTSYCALCERALRSHHPHHEDTEELTDGWEKGVAENDG